MTSPNVYPITYNFEQACEEVEIDPNVKLSSVDLKERMAEFINEYEHGTADVSDLFGGLDIDTLTGLTMASHVLIDFLLYVNSYQRKVPDVYPR